MSTARYTILAILVVAATLGLAWPLALGRLDAPERWAIVLGGAIALANTAAAHALARWADGRSTLAFLRAVLGGMLGRMGLMLVAVTAAILALRLPETPLIVSLLSYFTVFLVMELSVLHRHSTAARTP